MQPCARKIPINICSPLAPHLTTLRAMVIICRTTIASQLDLGSSYSPATQGAVQERFNSTFQELSEKNLGLRV